jgi:hypothetical protein
MNPRLWVLLLAIAGRASAAGSEGVNSANSAAAPTPNCALVASASTVGTAAPKPARSSIIHDGQTFDLANSTATKLVETDEYTTGGEKLGEWTQLVTVQRVTLDKPASPDAFVSYFKKRVAEDGATLEVLAGTKGACVFAVRFPNSDRNDEQVMICLAFADAGRPELLDIVQYAIKPTKCPVDVAAARIKSWRDKFLAQAKALTPVL